MWDFEFEFPGRGDNAVRAGNEVRTIMRAVSATSKDLRLETGAPFEVREGRRVVGRGRVLTTLPG